MDRTSKLYYTHPLKGEHKKLGLFYLVHNGNVYNLDFYKKKFKIEKDNSKTLDYSDSWLLVKLIEKLDYDNWKDLLINFIDLVPCAYSLIIYSKEDNSLYLLKDRYGIRPLCIGENKLGYCVASESNGLGDYKYINELDNGSIYSINNKGLIKIYEYKNSELRQCLFEFIYFLNKNSYFKLEPQEVIKYEDFNEEIIKNDKSYLRMDDYRYFIGVELAKQENYNIVFNQKENIVVIGAPDTGIPSGKGFADYLEVEYKQFIYKKPKQGRSFILEDNKSRIQQIKNKFGVDEYLSIENKIVYFVDDSLVRGNTIHTIIELLYSYKPKEIHIRIVSPKVIFPCIYGIDIPTKKELIMNRYTEQELAIHYNIKSIKFLNLKSMNNCITNIYNNGINNFCTSCFDGEYIGQVYEF